jgi:hypothetical protein
MAANLKSGDSRSCGCLARERAGKKSGRPSPLLLDMAGQRFGLLLVLSRAGSTAAGKAVWACVCDCGETREVVGGELRRGAARSCGCLNREIAGATASEQTRNRRLTSRKRPANARRPGRESLGRQSPAKAP